MKVELKYNRAKKTYTLNAQGLSRDQVHNLYGACHNLQLADLRQGLRQAGVSLDLFGEVEHEKMVLETVQSMLILNNGFRIQAVKFVRLELNIGLHESLAYVNKQLDYLYSNKFLGSRAG